MLRHPPFILSFIVIIACICAKTEAKSVYAIIDHSSGTIKAYPINGNQLGESYAQAAFHHGEALNIAADSELNILFLTYEGGGIVCADARLMIENYFLHTPEMAGMVADEEKQLLYAAVRQTNRLYVCQWNGNTLVLIDNVALADLGGEGAYGIALDKTTHRLYVTNNTNMVNYYDANDPCWAHLGSRNVGVKAMDIDVDPNKYLYFGGYQESGTSPTYLVKHNLNTDVNSNTQQDIGTTVIGIAVDQESGLVYVTTTDKQVRIYDCSGYPFIQTYSVNTGGYTYPTGICLFSAANPLGIIKSSDILSGDCVLPGREINFTITYDFNGPDNCNAVLIDNLPVEVDYNSSIPAAGYDPVARTVKWNLGTIPSVSNGTFLLKVNVNKLAEPYSTFKNTCEFKSNFVYGYSEATALVCDWNPGVVYVDCSRTDGENSGMSWKNAYLELQPALIRVGFGCGSEIWVARGTYNASSINPYNPSYGPTFYFYDNTPAYGHFAGNETYLSQRISSDPNNETILSGDGDHVVTAWGLSRNNTIDGFTISGNNYSEILISDAYLTVSNCIIDGNTTSYSGITISGTGSAVISNCTICNNERGVYFSSSPPPPSDLTVITGCKIFANSSMGVFVSTNTNTDIHDNWIYRNGESGIFVSLQTGSTTIRNNTIFGNSSFGINCRSYTKPTITSSIIWGNSPGDLSGCNGSYSWLTTSGDPYFVNADADDFHLRPASLCIDAGDPNFRDFNETDIDSEHRIMDGNHDCIWRVDIGADEFHWPMADFNKNDIVDFSDFVIFANSWKTTNPGKSFDSDNDVDIDDLTRFFESWLWYQPKPDLDRNRRVDFIDFSLLAASWQTFDGYISLDEDCDFDIYDLNIFCNHWLLEE
jgi:hypothetical protein